MAPLKHVKSLRQTFRNLWILVVLVFVSFAVPTVWYFHAKTTLQENEAYLLTMLQVFQPRIADLRDATIQLNHSRMEGLLMELRAEPGVTSVEFQPFGINEVGCDARGLKTLPLRYCVMSEARIRALIPMEFANRPYGTLVIDLAGPSHVSRFWLQAFGVLIGLACLALGCTYALSWRIFRQNVVLPIRSLVQRLRRGTASDDGSGLVGELQTLTGEIETLLEEHTRDAKLASCGRLAAEVAHDLRQPLLVLDTFARHVQPVIADSYIQFEYSKHVPPALHQLKNLSEQLLELSREPELDRKPSRLDDFAQTFLDEYRAAHPDALERIRFELKGDSFPCVIDEMEMRRVLSNLLNNAFNSMANNGIVRVRILSEATPAGKVVIEVKDDGCGIEDKRLSRIFEPFVTTRCGGTGIGLAVTRKIVIRHGGEITANSKVGKGSTFRISLPAVAGSA